jgi:hypothetical protein
MNLRKWWLLAAVSLTTFALYCNRSSSSPTVEIRVPPGFTGQIELQLGKDGALPLAHEGNTYIVQVPDDGKVSTSTVLDSEPRYKVSGGQVWGYMCSVYKAGDGLAVGGRIQMFIGTKEQYETFEANKRKSHIPMIPQEHRGAVMVTAS